MAISTNSNILIQGNTVDYGTNMDAINGNGYTNCINLNLDLNQVADPEAQYAQPGYAKITDNFLSGIPDAPTTSVHIALVGGSTIITNNTFIGPGIQNQGINIKAYITVDSLNDQVITDNIFDSPTVDSLLAGVNETLVLGVGTNSFTTTSTYHSNKNQTGYLPISKTPNLIDFDYKSGPAATTPIQSFYSFDSDPGNTTDGYVRCKYGNFTIGTKPSLSNPFDNMVPPYTPPPPVSTGTPNYIGCEGTAILYGPSDTSVISYTFSIDVNEYLPNNVQILNFVVGITADGYTLETGVANYQLWSASSVSAVPVAPPTAYNSFTISTILANSLADVRNTIGVPPASQTTPVVASEQTAGLQVKNPAGANQVTAAQLNSATQYIFLDVSGEPQYFVTPGTRISVVYQATTAVSGNTSPVYIYESPLIVKYRW
jgi:hypothetical protein